MDSAAWLLLGMVLGFCIKRCRVKHYTTMVFPSVRDRPLIYTVSKIRSHANNSETDPIKEDGGPETDDRPRRSKMRFLRPNRHRRVA